MYFRILLIFTVLFEACSSADLAGDEKLGSRIYFSIDPVFNSVNFATGPWYDPMRISQPIIKNIEFVGYNDEKIAVVSKQDHTILYWIIDKTAEPILINDTVSEISTLTNLQGPLDSLRFSEILSQEKIKLIHASFFRKKYNYE